MKPLLFEGQRLANDYAETESRKLNTELCVVKCDIGGIVYEVSAPDKIRKNGKILGKYKNGIRQ